MEHVDEGDGTVNVKLLLYFCFLFLALKINNIQFRIKATELNTFLHIFHHKDLHIFKKFGFYKMALPSPTMALQKIS